MWRMWSVQTLIFIAAVVVCSGAYTSMVAVAD